MAKKVSFGKAAGLGAKDTLAMGLITMGVAELNKGDYLVGGAFVTIGWVLLVVDHVLK